jgi:hypothetical protein
MPRLHILCPTQNRPFATSIECSVEHKPSLPNIIKYCYCPYCQQLHGWTPDEAFFVEVYETSKSRAAKAQQLRVKAFNELDWRSKGFRHALPAFIRQFRATVRVTTLQVMSHFTK